MIETPAQLQQAIEQMGWIQRGCGRNRNGKNGETPALTLTLSPKEREQRLGLAGRSDVQSHFAAAWFLEAKDGRMIQGRRLAADRRKILPPHEPERSVSTLQGVRQRKHAKAWTPNSALPVQGFKARNSGWEKSLPGGEGRGEGECRTIRAENGRIIPLTPSARATAALLNFDDPAREEARRKLAQAGRYP